MSKKRFVTTLINVALAVISLFSLSACSKTTEYGLYSYEYYGKTYGLGDTFYGVEIKKDLVVLKLKGEELELIISKAFVLGDPSKANEYQIYTGTYTETESTINALIPDFSSSTISITKTGNKFSLKLSSKTTIILMK